MSTLYGLVVRWLFVSRNGIKMQFLGVVRFKSTTLTVYCLSSWFVHQQRKTYSNLCVLCWLSHLSWFQGPKYILPSFWLWVTNHDVTSKILKKLFLKSLPFYKLFHDVEKLGRKPKIFLKVIQRFGIRETSNLTTDADSSTKTTVGWTKNTQKPKIKNTQKLKKLSKTEKLKNV